MAHFAELDADNRVVRVIVVADEDLNNADFPESESVGKAFISSIGLAGNWIQTSYNSYIEENGVPTHRLGGQVFRGCYAAVGGVYDSELDVFIPPNWSYENGRYTCPEQPKTLEPLSEAVSQSQLAHDRTAQGKIMEKPWLWENQNEG